MPDPLAFASAVGMSAAEIGGVLVASFAGYRYPPSPDPEGSMLERLATEDLRLDASIIARDGAGEAAGLSLLAVRGPDSWCGGFGLVPAYRGRGLAAAMMREQARRAAVAGARRMHLEVLEGNEPALRAYLRTGFRRVRDIGLWRRDGRVSSPRDRLPELPADEAVEAVDRLGGARQVWQRQPATLRLLAGRDGVRGAAWRQAVALWRPAPWGGTMLLTVVAADAGAAREALGAMAAALPSPLTLFNEPEGGPVAEALRGLGFARYDRQHELVLEPVGRD